MSSFRIFFISTLLSGCAGVGQPTTAGLDAVGPYPDNWENLVREYIKTSFVDPYSIRDSIAAAPYRNRKAFYDTWTVCVRLNAKNRMGGYSGLKYYSIGIKHMKIDQVSDRGSHDCLETDGAKNLQFKPFLIN